MAKRNRRSTPDLYQLVLPVNEQSRPKSERAQKASGTRPKKSPAYAYSSLLFAEPSFLRGVARLLDFSGSLSDYNFGLTPRETDALALAADRRAVLQDYRDAHEQIRRQLGGALAG